jgi:hypothetical protein
LLWGSWNDQAQSHQQNSGFRAAGVLFSNRVIEADIGAAGQRTARSQRVIDGASAAEVGPQMISSPNAASAWPADEVDKNPPTCPASRPPEADARGDAGKRARPDTGTAAKSSP